MVEGENNGGGSEFCLVLSIFNINVSSFLKFNFQNVFNFPVSNV